MSVMNYSLIICLITLSANEWLNRELSGSFDHFMSQIELDKGLSRILDFPAPLGDVSQILRITYDYHGRY